MKKVEVSYLRIIAMIMVVIYHCFYQFGSGYSMSENIFPHIDLYEHLNKFLNSIDMPMFVFVSGYLFAYLKTKCQKYSDGKEFLLKKVKRLLIPFLLWAVVVDLLIYRGICPSHFVFPACHLWFLLMLMWCFVFIFVTRFLWEKQSLMVNICFCLAFSALYFVLGKLDLLSPFLCMDSFLVYFPIFYLGVIWARFSIPEKWTHLNKSFLWGVLLAFVALVALFTYNEFRFHSDLLARVMGICLTLTLFQLLFVPSDTKTNGMSPLLSSLDASGMGIYILHQIVIILLLNQFVVASFINEHEVIGPILLFCVVFFGCWGVVALINKTKLKFIFG